MIGKDVKSFQSGIMRFLACCDCVIARSQSRIFVYVVILILLGVGTSGAEAYQQPKPEEGYIITHYGVPEGLPSKTVTDITFGKDSYLYLASVNGLIRMDGHHIDVFSTTKDSGFSSDRISRIYSLSPQTLIVKDHQGFLYRFTEEKAYPLINSRTGKHINTPVVKEMEQSQFLVLDQEYAYAVTDDSLSILRESLSTHSIWDGEYYKGIVYVLNSDGFYKSGQTGYTKIPMPERYKPDLSFYSRIETIDGHYHIIGRQKSACYDPDNDRWCPIHSFVLEDEQEEVLNMKREGDEFFIATSESYYRHQDGNLEEQYDTEVRKGIRYESTFNTSYGEILVGANGVWVNDELVFEPESRIDDADIDSDEGLWISSSQDGVYNIRKNKFSNYTDEAIINSYSIIKDEDNNFWSGSFENGLITWNENRAEVFNQENGALPSNTIRMISPLSNNRVLVSVWGEPPFIFEEGNIEQLTDFWPLFGNRTNVTEAFYEDRAGRFWLGTLNGLYIKEGNRYSVFYDRNQRTLSKITRIVESPFNNDVYFCTANEGLVLLRNNEFHFLTADLPASSMHIRDVYVASTDTIWAASYNSGLQRYIVGDNSGDWQVGELNYQMGLEDAGYHRIIPDSLGSFWISSNDGLLQVSKKGLSRSIDRGVITTNLNWFREDDGLVDREFNGGSQSTGLNENGKIWFANISGLVSFNPYSFYDNGLNTQNFRLQRVLVSDGIAKAINDNRIELEKDQRQVELKFAHISYDKNRTDQVWVKVSDNGEWERPEIPGFFNVDQLSSGETKVYFSVGAGSSVLTSATIFVTPYLYEILGFQIFVGAVVALFGFLIFKTRVQKKNEKIAAEEKEEAGIEEVQVIKDPVKILIDENFRDSSLTIDTIAQKLSVSRSTLYRSWNEKNDESILDYLSNVRLEHAKKLIKEGELTITEIAYESGFSSQSYFTKVFKKKHGITPSEYADETAQLF